MKTLFTFCIAILFVLNLNAQWESFEMPFPRLQTQAVCYQEHVYLGGGQDGSGNEINMIDIFNTNTKEWTQSELPTTRLFPTVMAANNKLFYAGGASINDEKMFKEVEIFDPSQNTWSYDSLSQARITTSVVVGNKIVFSGGFVVDFTTLELSPTNIVDIYNFTTEEWEVTQFPAPRLGITPVAFGDKIYYAGGHAIDGTVTKRIDIYNTTNNTWTLDSLSVARSILSSASVGDKILFVGGVDANGTNNTVDIIDGTTGQKTTTSIFSGRAGARAVTLGNKAFFTNGGEYDLVSAFYTTATSLVDVYDSSTGEWEVLNTAEERINHFACGCNEKLYIGGGFDFNTGGINILEEYDPSLTNTTNTFSNMAISIFPNPAMEQINISLNDDSSNLIKEIQLQNIEGKVLLKQNNLNTKTTDLNLQGLPNGMFLLSITTNESLITRKIIKE